jgi:pimeloyl-ACP methyl ester carboxylesterase
MIQGSGCQRVLNGTGRGTYSTLFNLLPFAAEQRFTVIAVEKPLAGMAPGEAAGTARDCSPQFNEDFTAETWLSALQASLNDARRLPWVDRRRTLVFGASEGAVMAALLAGQDKGVTDVISVGGSGTTQLFDHIAFAYQRCFNRSKCLEDVEAQARAIAAAPQSATLFAWGHPYKRWSSFFRIDPGASLLRSTARIYLAFGTADASVPALSQELTVARLLSAGRDVTVRRIPDAGHGLSSPGQPGMTEIDKEYRQALDWFWQVPLPDRPAR